MCTGSAAASSCTTERRTPISSGTWRVDGREWSQRWLVSRPTRTERHRARLRQLVQGPTSGGELLLRLLDLRVRLLRLLLQGLGLLAGLLGLGLELRQLTTQ